MSLYKRKWDTLEEEIPEELKGAVDGYKKRRRTAVEYKAEADEFFKKQQKREDKLETQRKAVLDQILRKRFFFVLDDQRMAQTVTPEQISKIESLGWERKLDVPSAAIVLVASLSVLNHFTSHKTFDASGTLIGVSEVLPVDLLIAKLFGKMMRTVQSIATGNELVEAVTFTAGMASRFGVQATDSFKVKHHRVWAALKHAEPQMHSKLTLLDADGYARFVAMNENVVKLDRLVDFQKWLDQVCRVDRSRSSKGTYMKLL